MISSVSAKRIPWYRHRWFKITGLVVVVVIGLIILSAGILYALWQSRPEKVLLEAADYAFITPATYKITSDGTDISVGIKDRQFTAAGTVDAVPLSAVFSENTLYIKSPQPEKLYDTYLGSSVPAMFATTIKSTLAGLKDRWISIDVYKLPSDAGTSGFAKCGIQTIAQVQDGTDSRTQTGFSYLANPFITTKTLATTPIQTTYQLSVDQSKLKSFTTSISKSDAYKDQSCSSSISAVANGDFENTSVEATITRPDHHLRDLTIHNTSNKTTKVQVDYSKIPTTTVPTDVVTYDQISNSLIRTFLSTFIGSR